METEVRRMVENAVRNMFEFVLCFASYFLLYQAWSCTILDFGSHQRPVSPVLVASGEAKGWFSPSQVRWE